MRSVRQLAWLGVAVWVLAAAAGLRADVVIVQDGEPRATIVLVEKPKKDEKGKKAPDPEEIAAEDLQRHIEMISGAKLPIVNKAADVKGVPIYIGAAAPDAGPEKIKGKSADPAALRVRVTNESIRLTGNTDAGTLCATYELLEQLGVRWLIGGELGTDVVESKTIKVKEQDLIDAPAFRGRHLQAVGAKDWERRNRLGGLSAGAHGLGPKFDNKAHPELFYKDENGKVSHQEKVSEPEVLKQTIAYWRAKLKENPNLEYINVGPHDGAGFGDDPWDSDDFDPILGLHTTTDRYVQFFNLILADLQKDYPNVGLAFYAYTQEMRPPIRETPNPKILPMLAAIGLDRFHSINNPLSWEKQYLKTVVDGWQAKGVKLMFRGYLFNLADHGMPFSMIDIVKNEWPYYYDKGFIAMRVECIPNWAYHAPSFYLAAKLYWAPHANADAIMNEWFDRMYGPAAPAMKEHFKTLEEAYIHGDYYTGNVFDVPRIVTPAVRKAMGESLAKAEQAAGKEGKYAERVKLIRIAYDYGEANFKMMEAYFRGDFVEAKKHHDVILNELIPLATKTDPPVIAPRSAVGYFKRFWSRTIVNGYEKVTGGREVVAHMPDEWKLFLDPNGVGDELFLYKPELGTTTWLPIKTISETSSDQGLRYYRGTAWYRCSVNVPEKFKGQKMQLWFGGIDDTPTVWVNGKPATQTAKGASPIGLPWEFDPGDALVAGKDNVIVVRVSDRAVQELGTYGINGPGLIWAEKP